ncbi:MAG: hypothetical protein R3F42_06500 [Pseudomonadota bacterium]
MTEASHQEQDHRTRTGAPGAAGAAQPDSDRTAHAARTIPVAGFPPIPGAFLLSLLLLSGCVATGTSSLYVYGYDKHFEPTPRTNEGNMGFVGYSRDYSRDKWNFETGISTYVDSYSKQSLMVFSNVSHEDYRYRYFTPVISLNCAYKGNSYEKDTMKLICTPPVSLRFGADTGLFVNVTPVPKVGSLTNGLISALIGYKFGKRSHPRPAVTTQELMPSTAPVNAIP